MTNSLNHKFVTNLSQIFCFYIQYDEFVETKIALNLHQICCSHDERVKTK